MPSLKCRADGTFTIVQFTDTHICDKPRNNETYRLFEVVLESEKTDLVVLSGDVVHATASADPLVHWREIARFFDDRRLPWAFAYGNHDPERYPHEKIDAILAASRYCLYEPGPEELFGRGNYAIPIRAHDGKSLAAIVWSLDSGMGAEGVPSGYDWVKEDQIAWFEAEADRLADGDGSRVTGLAFVHMPLHQHLTVWQTQPCRGYMYEKVCMQGKDLGLFDAFRKNRRVSGCFVGHDHTNDYEGTLDGVELCYGRGSGHNAYGREGYAKGARVIVLREGVKGYESHIRLEDGSLAERPVHEPDGNAVM